MYINHVPFHNFDTMQGVGTGEKVTRHFKRLLTQIWLHRCIGIVKNKKISKIRLNDDDNFVVP